MIESGIDGKTKIICNFCGYFRGFSSYADAITYLSGRGGLYGWFTATEDVNWHRCPMCSSNGDSYIIQMRLEMFL